MLVFGMLVTYIKMKLHFYCDSIPTNVTFFRLLGKELIVLNSHMNCSSHFCLKSAGTLSVHALDSVWYVTFLKHNGTPYIVKSLCLYCLGLCCNWVNHVFFLIHLTSKWSLSVPTYFIVHIWHFFEETILCAFIICRARLTNVSKLHGHPGFKHLNPFWTWYLC